MVGRATANLMPCLDLVPTYMDAKTTISNYWQMIIMEPMQSSLPDRVRFHSDNSLLIVITIS